MRSRFEKLCLWKKIVRNQQVLFDFGWVITGWSQVIFAGSLFSWGNVKAE